MQILIIQEHQLWKQDRLPVTLAALPLTPYVEHLYGCHLCKALCSDPCRHCDERVIPAAARNRVELVLPSLKSLLKLTLHVGKGCLFRLFHAYAEIKILLQ